MARDSSPVSWASVQVMTYTCSPTDPRDHVPIGRPIANVTARVRFPTLTYADSAIDACRDADLVLHLTEWPEFREITPGDLVGVVARPQLFDGRNVLDLDTWRSAGWTARALGRR